MATHLDLVSPELSATAVGHQGVSRLPSRTEETDVWMASTLGSALLHAAIIVPMLVLGAQAIGAGESYERPPAPAPITSMAVRVKMSDFNKPKEIEVKPVVVPTPPQVAKVKPPEPEVKPPEPVVKPPEPKAKPPKRRPARKTSKLRKKKPKKRPAADAPDGRAQRLLSKGDKPAPSGPAPSDLKLAGSGAVGDGPPAPPAAGRPDGDKDGIGHKPATIKTPPAPTAPAIDLKRLLRSYLKRVAKAVRKDFNYPRAALRAGMEGRVVVAVTIDAEGRIVGAKLSKSSGYDVLDRAAVAAAKSIDRVPKAPTELQWQRRKVKIPFKFRLRT